MIPTEPADRHRMVAGTFGERVRAVTDWTAPAPVAGWTAADVVDHLIEWSTGFLAAGGVTLSSTASTVAPTGDDPAARWEQHAAGIQALLDGGDASRPFTHPQAGTGPLATTIDRIYTSDVFMHTWDLARATGQDDGLDPDECARLLAGMEPMEDVLRASGHYGPRVEVPDSTPPPLKLMAFIGRDPSWSTSTRSGTTGG